MNESEVRYIDKAMAKAVYDELEDGAFCGRIPQCPGVIAFGETMYQCGQELRTSLEGWITVKIRHGDKIPAIDSIVINTNKRTPLRETAGYDKVVAV